MWTCGFAFSICLSVALASEFESIDHDGWVPVSSDIIYNQIRRGFTQAPRFTKSDDVQILNTDILSFVSQHQEYEDIGSKLDTKKCIDQLNDDSIAYIDDTSESNILLNKILIPADHNVKTDATIRRAKKLIDIDANQFINKIFLSNKKNPENKNNSQRLKDQTKTQSMRRKAETYEVTETMSIEDEKQEESQVKENGYAYKQPVQRNSTNNLIKHLYKYNIENIDNLQNYALSRQPKAKSSVKQDNLHKTLQFQVPVRYNSLNHLPVDPLLAVFLSNYGYYLQGQYGIQNNYNNWYGYLASNNIHNNRPFGLYKLFSDTDSSNK